jgi:hypothetical protein
VVEILASWAARIEKPRPAQEVTMSTHYVFVNVEASPPLVGVGTLNPPETRGMVIEQIESDETDQAKLLALAEQSTSLRLLKQRKRPTKDVLTRALGSCREAAMRRPGRSDQ